MAMIETGSRLMTLVNVFTVAPDQQAQLAELLVRATHETMRYLPGFVSASIHRSVDGTKVINYAQWRSEAEFRAMRDDPRRPATHGGCGTPGELRAHRLRGCRVGLGGDLIRTDAARGGRTNR